MADWTSRSSDDHPAPSRGDLKSIAATFGLFVALFGVLRAFPGDEPSSVAKRGTLAGRVLESHSGPVFALAWSPDGQGLATSHAGNSIAIHHMISGRRVHLELESESHSPRFALGWSKDGGSLLLWGVDNSVELRTVEASSDSGPRPTDRSLAEALQGSSVRLWGPSDLRVRRLPKEAAISNAMALSPDGRTIASGGTDGQVRIWDAETGKLRWGTTAIVPGLRVRGVSSVAFRPDGKTLATAGVGPILCFDAASGRQVASMSCDSGGFAIVCYSPDGSKLAAATWDGAILVWDVESGRDLAKIPSKNSRIASLAWSPDGVKLASGSFDGVLRLFDLQGLLPESPVGTSSRQVARLDQAAR